MIHDRSRSRIVEVKTKNDAWVVAVRDIPEPLTVHATKEEAIETAGVFANASKPAVVVVLRADGTTEAEYYFVT